MRMKSLSRPEQWILLGIPLLFILGSIMHFMYNLLGESVIIGLFAPVNESICEHSKLVVWPMILWWTLYYCFRKKKHPIDKNKWFTGALVALITAFMTMPLAYYFYTGAFGAELLWVDILILLIAVLFGQWLGLHTYRYTKGLNAKYILLIFAGIVLLFMLLTFFPPRIPLFQDGVTGSYGIAPHTS